jgi:hypothetical protein
LHVFETIGVSFSITIMHADERISLEKPLGDERSGFHLSIEP